MVKVRLNTTFFKCVKQIELMEESRKDIGLSEKELKEIKDLERRARLAVWRASTGRVEGELLTPKRITFVKEDENGNVIEETTYENPNFIKHIREHLRSRNPHTRKLITVDEVIEIHDRLIRKYGGKSGVLNKGLLEFPVDWVNQRRSKVSARSMPDRPSKELRPKYERALRRSMQRFDRILKEFSEM